MAYEDYINELRTGPKTVEYLKSHLHFSVHTIWNALSELETMGVVIKERKGRALNYQLSPNYQRDIPRIKADGKLGVRSYFNLNDILPAFNKSTKGIQALRFLPELSAKLLVIGLKAQRAHERMDTEGEKELKKLARELKALKLEAQNHYKALLNSYQMLQQIKNNEEFWTLNGLRKHYNPQLDEEGNAIPEIDATQALTIYQQLID